MERRTAILATLVSVLLCACPGLCLLAYGGNIAASGETSLISDVYTATRFGAFLLCVGLLAILVSLVVGLVTFRRSRPEPQVEDVDKPVPDPLTGE